MANNERARKKDSARLVWDSKPRRAPNPRDIEFQTAEVVIPNWVRDGGQIPMSFRDGLFGEQDLDKQQMNRLSWGDNLLAMQALLAQGYEGKISLIYIDPPFASSEDYYYSITLSGEEVTKEPSPVERLAYKDIWAGGIDSYLDMLHPRLYLMRRLLADRGSIYVHMDWHLGHHVKVLLDEVFGRENSLDEIIWHYGTPSGGRAAGNKPIKSHDIIFCYAKEYGKHVYNHVYLPYNEKYIRERFVFTDEAGRISPNPTTVRRKHVN